MSADYAKGPVPRGTSDALWADALGVRCTHCGAQPDIRCKNTITKHVMPVPHYHRLLAAEKAAT